MALRKQDLVGYALILPAMLGVLAFVIYPVEEVIRLSFTNTNYLTHRSDFVGFQSYERALSDPVMGLVVRNTFEWVIGNTVFSVLLGLGVGYFLSFNFGINRFLRSGILIPWILPSVVSIAAWKWMLHPELGVINDLLKKLGLIQVGIAWLGEPGLVMYALVTIGVWGSLPFVALVVSAAAQGIPDSLLQAATIDGANGWQKFLFIVLPSLTYPLTIIGMLTLIASMNNLVTVWGTTQGGPANSSVTLAALIYQTGFLSFRFGLSSALSVLNFVVLLGASVIYLACLGGTWKAGER
jgi:ABC-type sugar transport system permease subunit